MLKAYLQAFQKGMAVNIEMTSAFCANPLMCYLSGQWLLGVNFTGFVPPAHHILVAMFSAPLLHDPVKVKNLQAPLSSTGANEWN